MARVEMYEVRRGSGSRVLRRARRSRSACSCAGMVGSAAARGVSGESWGRRAACLVAGSGILVALGTSGSGRPRPSSPLAGASYVDGHHDQVGAEEGNGNN